VADVEQYGNCCRFTKITMHDTSQALTPANYFLEPGFVVMPSGPTVISAVLGSGVSICLFDRKRKVGGMNSFQLPLIREKGKTTTRYGNVAVWTLIRMMLEDGSKIKNLEAQIVGGAHNPELSSQNMGQENIRIARKILFREKIVVTSEDTGGSKGRKVVFSTHTNEIAILKVEKLRKSDWYPYEDDRNS
jgi:chemotaxis protein CheD